jgi:hypothetical protein
MGDGPNWNPPIAGYCLKLILGNDTQSIAVWPTTVNGGGGTVVNDTGAYGYSDPYYSTNNWDSGTSSWFCYYLSKVP